MGWVQQIVALVGDHDRGNDENRRLARAGPGRAEIRQCLWCRIGPPVRRQVGDRDVTSGDPGGDVRRNGDEIVRGVTDIEVNAVLERGQGEGGGCVDDGKAAPVPTSSGQPRALSVESRVLPEAHAPDAGQL